MTHETELRVEPFEWHYYVIVPIYLGRSNVIHIVEVYSVFDNQETDEPVHVALTIDQAKRWVEKVSTAEFQDTKPTVVINETDGRVKPFHWFGHLIVPVYQGNGENLDVVEVYSSPKDYEHGDPAQQCLTMLRAKQWAERNTLEAVVQAKSVDYDEIDRRNRDWDMLVERMQTELLRPDDKPQEVSADVQVKDGVIRIVLELNIKLHQ